MQVESVQFLPTGRSEAELFEFKPDKFNLLLRAEDQTKSNIFSTLAITLAGKTAEDFLGIIPSQADTSINLGGQRLIISKGQNELNEDLSAINKDLLSNLFIVDEDGGVNSLIADSQSRLTLLNQFASRSLKGSSVEKAIRLVEERLEKYPFRGKTYKIDDLCAGLNRGKIVLEERLLQLEKERLEASKHIDELKSLEEELEKTRRRQKREEYFQLCLETAELDARIMKVQHRLMHEAELKREIASLNDLADFPIAALRKVQELWTMRQARLADRDRLEEELAHGRKEMQELENAYSTVSQGLEQFSIEDTQELFGIAKNMIAAREELEQLQLERDQEMRRVKESGVDFDNISLVRKSLLTIEPRQLEEAYKLSTDLKWHKEQLANLAGLSQGAGTQLKSLSAELSSFNIKSRQLRFVLVTLAAASATIVILVYASGPSSVFEVFSTIFLTSFVLALIALCFLPSLLTGFRKEMESKVEAIVSQQGDYDGKELELSKTVADIQAKAEEIAKSYNFASHSDLFKKLQNYASISARLKELDVLDRMLTSREQHLSHLSKDGQAYLDKIKRKISIITPEALSGLAFEILRHKEKLREFERMNAVLNHRKSELRFLDGELKDLDSILRDFFLKAHLSETGKMESLFEEFERKAQAYKKWESLSQELKRMATDITSEIFEHDLSTVLSKLQHRRTDAWTKMQDLIALYPDILTETIEDSELGRLGQADIESTNARTIEKQARADELRSLVRTAARNFDEYHPKTQHELEIMERDLQKIKSTRASLTLARECMMQVLQESKNTWSKELTDISEQLLSGAHLEIEKIDWNENLEINVLLKGQSEPIAENSFSLKLPGILIKQLRWLTRIVLCLFVARRLNLPLVLNEPFRDLDDKGFAGCMDLLLCKVLPHLQLILLSCQQVRLEWYLNRLSANDKERIFLL